MKPLSSGKKHSCSKANGSLCTGTIDRCVFSKFRLQADETRKVFLAFLTRCRSWLEVSSYGRLLSSCRQVLANCRSGHWSGVSPRVVRGSPRLRGCCWQRRERKRTTLCPVRKKENCWHEAWSLAGAFFAILATAVRSAAMLNSGGWLLCQCAALG